MRLVFVLLACAVAQIPGNLDVAFGEGGLTAEPETEVDHVVASTVTDDENLLLVRQRAAYLLGFGVDIVSFAKILPEDGSRNSTFGTVLVAGSGYQPKKAGLFPGGNFYVLGCASIGNVPFYWMGVFDQGTGQPILTFGDNGHLLIPTSTSSNSCLSDLALMENSTMMLIGNGYVEGMRDMVSIRASQITGQVDPTWGNQPFGVRVFNFTESSFDTEAACVFALANGNVLIGGTHNPRSPDLSSAFAAIISGSGQVLDHNEFVMPDFRPEPVGNVTTQYRLSNGTRVMSCVRSPATGGIYMGVLAPGKYMGVALLQFSSVELDSAYGDGGTVVVPEFTSSLGGDQEILLATMPTGSLVLGGMTGTAFPFSFSSTRLLPDGSRDLSWQGTFSGFPFLSTNAGMAVNAIQAQNTGKLLISGQLFRPFSLGITFRLHCQPDAVPCDAGPQCFCVGALSCSTQGDYVLPPGETPKLDGPVFVNGNLVSGNGTITIRPPPYGGGIINVGGFVSTNGGTLVVNVNASGTYTVINSGAGISGAFDNVVVSDDDLQECQRASSDVETSNGGSTLSVVVVVEDTPGCLTRNQIIGVAVGAAACGILIAVVMLLLMIRRRNKWTEKRAHELKQTELDNLGRSQPRNPTFQGSDDSF